MKRQFFFIFLFVVCLAACQREEALPETTSAAKEIYRQYAGRKDLTVALIGDYNGYNAVMLQAESKADWLRLCEEFDVKHNVNVDALDSSRVSSLKKVSGVRKITKDFDGVGSIGEAVRQMIDSVMAEAIHSGATSKSIVFDTTYSVVHSEHYDNGLLVDSSTTVDNAPVQQPDKLMNTAHLHGNIGYLIHSDSDNLALWLFFYSSMEEFEQIINKISSKNIRQ